jgi:hypothetical protein
MIMAMQMCEQVRLWGLYSGNLALVRQTLLQEGGEFEDDDGEYFEDDPQIIPQSSIF